MFGFKSYSDQKVIEEIRNGNEEMLVYVYKQNYTPVRNFILRNNGEEDDIDDILQEGVIALWQNVMKEEFHLSAKLTTYLLAIVKNLWFKQLKKKNRLVRIDETGSEREKVEGNSVNVLSSIDLTAIHEIMAEMDETCRKLLSYFYFDGYSNKVIATKLGFANTDTVKSKKYQCFKKLEGKVKEAYRKEDFFD